MEKKLGKVPIVIILGPTAVGKTEVSIQVAKQVNGEIISVDSRLFYKGMDIGTAKPSVEERLEVIHHLIDVTTPDKVWSLADFQKAAFNAIDIIHAKGKLPILVGGSGQYVRAITDGWVLPRVPPNPKIRRVLEQWAEEIGYEALHQRLQVLDPVASAKIDPPNLRRTIRALEVIMETGKRFSEQRTRKTTTFRILKIGLIRPRKELYQRIDIRIERMIAKGLENEVRGLLERGYSLENPPLSAIGYRQMIQYIQGEISLDDTIKLMKRKTREFVRRQANWFKEKDETIEWFVVDGHTVELVVNKIRRFLEGEL